MTTSASSTYSLLTDPIEGSTGTGLDQLVAIIQRDPGLAGANDGRDIKHGAESADAMSRLIIEAAHATGADADAVFTGDEVVAMNAYLRANHLDQWTALHGDDEDGTATGFHLVQNDGATTRYRGNNLVDTVADGIYHLGFEIQDGRFLNEDGDANASVCDVAAWLTQFYTDHSTTGTGLDRITDLVMADAGLASHISDEDIAAGADAADGLNAMIGAALAATRVADDGWISVDDVVAMNHYLHDDAARAAAWASLHGDDECGLESGFHHVQNDGARTRFFGENLVDTVADGIYHLGFAIENGRLLNEDGDPNACLGDVADWLNYFLIDQSTTGTGLDYIVDRIKLDRGLARNTSAADINGGAAAANGLNGIIADLVVDLSANSDGWITTEDVIAMNAAIQSNADLLARWTELHGDDEDGVSTGYHLVQNNGAATTFFDRNLLDTVADGIYHLGFEISHGRFLNEDGDENATIADVASWLNFFYNQTVLTYGDDGDDTLSGDDRAEQINAASGNDFIDAGGGNDLVYGGYGNDTIDGGTGNDLVYAGKGNDEVDGGLGDDTFRVTGNKAQGFEGYDAYADAGGIDAIVAYGGAVDIGMRSFVATGIETIDASAATGPVRILGDGGANILDFSATVFIGKIVIDGAGGNDTIRGTAGNDVIEGGSGNEALAGGDGDDVIHGGRGTDGIDGGGGNDLIQVTGNKGSGFEGYDSYQGGDGIDTLAAYGSAVDIGMKSFGLAASIEILDLAGATGPVRIVGDSSANVLDFSTVTVKGKLVIESGGGNDRITGSAGDDLIEGGSWGSKVLAGGAGNDVIHAGRGDDSVDGGSGNDVFRVTGNKSNGFEGFDSYQGGDGNDAIVAYGGTVDIGMTGFGAANGVEAIDATSAALARILGDGADNLLDFSAVTFLGKVEVDAASGSDRIVGTAGADTLRGGAGNDRIDGAAGNDTLYGNQGYDVFAFGQNSGHDVLADFRDGQDRLDFAASGAHAIGDLLIQQVTNGTLVSHDGSDVLLVGIAASQLTQADFIF